MARARLGERMEEVVMDEIAKVLIMLVEDHPDSAEVFIELLEEEGYQVVWASTGRAAVEAMDPRRGQPVPSLILLDLTLPDMDGVTLTRRLRLSRAQLPPVIVCSAKPLAAVLSAVAEVGAAGFLRKPCGIDELLGTMAKVLAKPGIQLSAPVQVIGRA